ncbi:MAG: hypothetical protein ILP02_03195 [Clostridia bacterium]|nr:hypothetical protein [Clostridia bacterium]
MNKKKDTPGRLIRRRYEERHKAERKAQYKVWGTSVSRPLAEEIDAYLKEEGITKVTLIMEGYKALKAKEKAE